MLKNDNNFGDEKYTKHLLFCFDNFRKKILIYQKKNRFEERDLKFRHIQVPFDC